MKNDKGISIIEILIVVVIIVATVGFFAANRKSQLNMAYSTEARALIDDIVEKERVAKAANGVYSAVNDTNFAVIGNIEPVDASRNMYFRFFKVELNGTDGFVVTVRVAPETNIKDDRGMLLTSSKTYTDN